MESDRQHTGPTLHRRLSRATILPQCLPKASFNMNSSSTLNIYSCLISVPTPNSQTHWLWPPLISTVYWERRTDSPRLTPPSILDSSYYTISSPHTPRSSTLQLKSSSTLWSLSLSSAEYIDGVLLIGLGALGPLPSPPKLGGNPEYLVLGQLECGPRCPCLLLFPISMLPQIANLLDETPNVETVYYKSM